jgi:hypothetical protein
MKGLLNKVRGTPEVLGLVDQAEDLESAEKQHLEATKMIFGPAFKAFVSDTPPGIRDSLGIIQGHGQKFLATLQESAQERKISGELIKLRANQESFTKLKSQNKSLEEKYKDAISTAEKRKRDLDSSERKGEPIAIAKAKSAYESATAALETARKLSEESNTKMETEVVTYRKNVVDLLTTPLETLAESRISALEKGIEFGRLLAAQAAALKCEMGSDGQLVREYRQLCDEIRKAQTSPEASKPEGGGEAAAPAASAD